MAKKNPSEQKKAICYIRVSDKHKGDKETQHNAIEEYCQQYHFKVIDYVVEYVSASKTDIQDRELARAVEEMELGAVLVMTDVSRLGRRKVFDLLGVIGRIVEKGELHFAYTDRVVNADNADDAETIFTVVGGSYAAVDEAKKRSMRAKAAVDRRRANGLHVGRKKGQQVKSKLDRHSLRIARAVNGHENLTALATELECSRAQLYRWINKNIKKSNNGQQTLCV